MIPSAKGSKPPSLWPNTSDHKTDLIDPSAIAMGDAMSQGIDELGASHTEGHALTNCATLLFLKVGLKYFTKALKGLLH